MEDSGTAKPENQVGDQLPAERTGSRIADLDDVQRSHTEGLLDVLCEEGDHLPDSAQNIIDTVKNYLSRPPPDAAHTVADMRQSVASAPHEGIDGGSAVTGMILAGALMVKATQLGVHYWQERKETGHGG